MGGEGSGEHLVEGVRPYRIEFGSDLVGECAFLEGENTAAMTDHVGIGRRHRVIEGEGFRIQGQLQAVGAGIGVLGGTHVAISIPGGLAILEFDAVQHAVADKPVLGPAGLGIRRVADVAAAEFGRDGPLHFELVAEHRDFVEYGRSALDEMPRGVGPLSARVECWMGLGHDFPLSWSARILTP